MDVMKSLVIVAVGIACVHCQNTNPVSNSNARTLATGGNEFVVTGGGNPPSGGSGSLLDIALASFGTSTGGQANPQPVDPNQPPQTQPVGSGNFVDAVNNLLSTGTSQMDPNVLTNLGLPTDQNTQNTGTQPVNQEFQNNPGPVNQGFPNNPGPMLPNDPSVTTGLTGGLPLRDPNTVPITDPNAGPVGSRPVGDPNAIGGGVVFQVDPQSGMNRGPIIGDTAAVQYSSAGSMPQNFPDPNTARNAVDLNAPLSSGSVFELTGQPQPGIYPSMPSTDNMMGPQGGPNPGESLSAASGNAGGPLNTVSSSAGGQLSAINGNAGGTNSFGVAGSQQMTNPQAGNGGSGNSLGAPPNGGILSSLRNNGLPGPGMPSGPLAALKATPGAVKKPAPKDNNMMEMLVLSMVMGGGEMNPALLAMAMGSMGNGGNSMGALPLILSLTGM